jgi:GAF domain-containing protein
MSSAYRQKEQEISALLTGFWLTDLANFAAFAFQEVGDLNWAGFYLADSDRLRLGPFCGKPACTEIRFDRGVCGASYTKKESILVPNVHEFPGHIACDSASNSELVIPLVKDNRCFGVFDLDSPTFDRFTEQDRIGLEGWTRLLLEKIPSEVWLRSPWRSQ